jgi:outer membrane murein-binding lipoprotein Lpp
VKKLLLTTGILAAIVLSGCQTAGENPLVVELQDKVASLESQITDLAASSEAAAEENTETGASHDQVFQVVVGTYLLDNAGLHGIDEGLQEAEEIDASYLGVIQRIRGVVAATPWPEELQAQSTGLVEAMDSLAEALEADDLEAARSGATEVHEAQHDFSHAVGEWLAEHGVVPEGEHEDE